MLFHFCCLEFYCFKLSIFAVMKFQFPSFITIFSIFSYSTFSSFGCSGVIQPHLVMEFIVLNKYKYNRVFFTLEKGLSRRFYINLLNIYALISLTILTFAPLFLIPSIFSKFGWTWVPKTLPFIESLSCIFRVNSKKQQANIFIRRAFLYRIDFI